MSSAFLTVNNTHPLDGAAAVAVVSLQAVGQLARLVLAHSIALVLTLSGWPSEAIRGRLAQARNRLRSELRKPREIEPSSWQRSPFWLTFHFPTCWPLPPFSRCFTPSRLRKLEALL